MIYWISGAAIALLILGFVMLMAQIIYWVNKTRGRRDEELG